MKFIEVWNITTQQLDTSKFFAPIIVGSIFIVLGIIGWYSKKKWGDKSALYTLIKYFINAPFKGDPIYQSIAVGTIAVIIGVCILGLIEVEKSRVSDELNSPDLKIVQGIVKVEFQQPSYGKTQGDIVHIKDKTFEINYYVATLYYTMTIAHGGHLTNGKYVRVYYMPSKTDNGKENYRDLKILKIEERAKAVSGNSNYNSL